MNDRITKIYDTSLESVNEGKREVVSIINSDSVDREGEVVQPSGMKRSNFKNNPVIYANHDYKSLPIGRSLWIKADTTVDGRNVLKAKSYISDKTDLARDCFGLIQDGVLSGCSIGFQSLRASPPSTKEINARPDLKTAKLIHRDWEILEYSFTGLPCNPDALTLAVSKGLSSETIEFLKAGNNVQAAAEVVAAVQQVEAEKNSAISQKDLADLLAKTIEERYTKRVNPDSVVAQVFQKLYGTRR